MNQADLIIAKAKAMDLLMEFAEDFHSEDLEGLERTDQFIEVYKRLKAEVAALTAEVARLREAAEMVVSTEATTRLLLDSDSPLGLAIADLAAALSDTEKGGK